MDRPHVTLKLATSLDGRIATASGESRWITGVEARAQVQAMRAATDAVMIGAGTARADDPSLLARTEPAPLRQPIRIVVSSSLDLPVEGRLFEQLDQSPLFVLACAGGDPDRARALQEAGAQLVWTRPKDGGIDWPDAFAQLTGLGLRKVLVEGGGALAASLMAAHVVDRIEWFRAPILLGAEGRPAVGGLALTVLADAPRWRRVALRELGPDLWESYERA